MFLSKEGGFGASLETELREKIGDVVFDGLLGQKHLRRYFAIGHAFAEQLQNAVLLLINIAGIYRWLPGAKADE